MIRPISACFCRLYAKLPTPPDRLTNLFKQLTETRVASLFPKRAAPYLLSTVAVIGVALLIKIAVSRLYLIKSKTALRCMFEKLKGSQPDHFAYFLCDKKKEVERRAENKLGMPIKLTHFSGQSFSAVQPQAPVFLFSDQKDFVLAGIYDLGELDPFEDLSDQFDDSGEVDPFDDLSDLFAEKFKDLSQTPEAVQAALQEAAKELKSVISGRAVVICYVDKVHGLVYTATVGDIMANRYRKGEDQSPFVTSLSPRRNHYSNLENIDFLTGRDTYSSAQKTGSVDEPEITVATVDSKDYIILSTKGLLDNWNARGGGISGILDTVLASTSLEDLPTQLIREPGSSPGNVTVVALKIT